MIAQVGGSQMLDGVKCAWLDGWLTIWLLHADVEGGDYLTANVILSAHIDASEQCEVVDAETGYLFHIEN